MADGPSGQFEIGRVLADVWRILRGGWQPIWLILLVMIVTPQVILGVVQLSLGYGVRAGSLHLPSTVFSGLPSPAFVGMVFVVAVVMAFVGFAGSICATYASVNFLNGEATTPREALHRVGQVYLPVLGLGLLVGLGVGLGTLLLIIPGLFLAVAWCVAVPVRTMERIKVVDAIARSYRLTDSVRWPIVGVFVILFCVYFAATLAVGIVSGVFGLVGARAVSAVIIAPLLQAAVVVAGAASTASVYHELVRIKEGGGSTVAEVFA